MVMPSNTFYEGVYYGSVFVLVASILFICVATLLEIKLTIPLCEVLLFGIVIGGTGLMALVYSE